MRLGIVATSGVMLAACLIALGQAPPDNGVAEPEMDSKALTLKMATHLTVVDITVTDKQGEAVHGLKQSDFTVLEDGKPQPLRSFGEYGLPSSQRVPPALPPNVYSNLQAPPTSSAENIFLLDLVNAAPADSSNLQQLNESVSRQHYVKVGALDYLKTMPVGTRVAAFALTERLQVLQGFTSSAPLLAAAIDAVPYDTLGRASTKEMRCMQQDSRNRSVLEGLRQIAVFAARTRGRKNLIWFTVGIPQIAIPNERPACLPDYTRDLSNTYDVLTAAQVAVYPIDVRGAGGILGSAQLSEDMVAEATGGVAYHNTNDIRTAIGLAVDNGANYYTVSYTPPDPKYDGKFHTIDVKVNRPGVSLVFRKGYYSDDPAKYPVPAGVNLPTSPPMVKNNDVKAAMSRSVPTSTQILFDVDVEPSTKPPKPGDPPVLGTLDAKLRGKKLVRYDFQYVLPARQLAFAPAAKGGKSGAVDFDLAVYDADGKLMTGLSQTLKMPLSADTYKQLVGGPLRFFQQIDLPQGQLFVRVGVLDRTSEKTGTLEIPLLVGKKAAGGKADAVPTPLVAPGVQ